MVGGLDASGDLFVPLDSYFNATQFNDVVLLDGRLWAEPQFKLSVVLVHEENLVCLRLNRLYLQNQVDSVMHLLFHVLLNFLESTPPADIDQRVVSQEIVTPFAQI